MSDIVKELKLFAKFEDEYLDNKKLFSEAADTIEALRAENARLLDCYKGATYTVDVLIKDNARLREAGREVVDWWLRDGMNKFDGAPAAMFRLRAALGDTE